MNKESKEPINEAVFFGIAISSLVTTLVIFISILILMFKITGWLFFLFIPFSFIVSYVGFKLLSYAEENY